MPKLLMVAVSAIFLSACTMVSHTVQPAVALQTQPSGVGTGHGVKLVVVDERPEKDVGNRGYDRGAPIKLEGDLAAVTQTSLETAFQHMGFRLDADAPVSLKVEWRDLRFEETHGLVTLGREATAAVKATVSNGSVRYERLYRSDLKTRGSIAASTGSAISDSVNAAINDVLNQMVSDPHLIASLTRPNR